MIDLHSHILWGIDDGARDRDESVAIARAAVEDGVVAIAGTPHVRGDYPTTSVEMERRVSDLRELLSLRGIPLEILPGGELAFDIMPELSDEELSHFGLGGNNRVLLVETPYEALPPAFVTAVQRIQSLGFTPLIAHPERNPHVQAHLEHVSRLVQGGALVQVTAASLDGRLGRATRVTAERLLDLGLVHVLASDAHAPDVRQVGLSSARAAVGDPELGRWLTEDVPRAIVDGRELPPRPGSPRRRRFRLRLGR